MPRTARKAPLRGDGGDRPEDRLQAGERSPARKASRDDGVDDGRLALLARAARMVRTPDSARSTPAVMAPTAVCAASEALRSRRTTSEARLRPDHDRDHRHAEQDPVDEGHRDEGPAGDDDPGDQVDQPRGDDRPQQRGVGADAGDEVAGAPPVELGDRQAQQAADQGRAGLEDERLPVRCST
jgi:hypothetical protein